MKKKDKIFVYLGGLINPLFSPLTGLYMTYLATQEAVLDDSVTEVHTTQTSFLNFKYAKRLFVTTGNKLHEITLGKCEGTDKEVREAHNIEKMLLNGAFDWFKPKL